MLYEQGYDRVIAFGVSGRLRLTLMVCVQFPQTLDRIRLRIVVHHLVMIGAHQDKVVERLALLVGLGRIEARAAKFICLDMADFADKARALCNGGLAFWKGTPI